MSLVALAWTYFRRRLLLSLSALGIALGVAVLFAVLAVINGFLSEFERSLREFTGDVIVRPQRLRREEPRSYADYAGVIRDVDGLLEIEPRLTWFGLVGRRGARALDDPRSSDLSGLLLVGTDSGLPAAAPGAPGARTTEAPAPPSPSEAPPLWAGEPLAERLGFVLGDSLEVVSFGVQSGGDPFPVRGTFRIAGTFRTGRFDQDLDRVFVRRTDLARFAQVEPDFTEILLRGEPGLEPAELAGRVESALGAAGLLARDRRNVFTWRAEGGNFLRAVENQRGILSTVFFFIVLVAAYQLVATLTLTVAEKRRDIGVMNAVGAGPLRIAAFFVSLGLVIATVGTGLGLLLGYWLSHNLEVVERWIGGGERIFLPEVYKFDRIPVAVDLDSILILVGATLAAALVFSFLPAWRAARLPILRALQSA